MSAGLLVLVAGPSGAGKDTLIAAAREALAGDARYVFARRIVTRAKNSFENHDTLSAEQFAAGIAAGRFALHWQAHGLSYGLARTIDEQIAEGKVVVCNVSRAAIPAARERYARVAVIHVDAHPDVRAARIAARGRDAAAGSRIDPARNELAFACDVTIDNSGPLATSAAEFTHALVALADHAAGARPGPG